MPGTVAACDEDGLWVRGSDGREIRAAFPNALTYARPGHDVVLAGTDAATGYVADLLVNRTSGETWHRQEFTDLSWSAAIGRVFIAHLPAVILMFIPLVNLVVGAYMGLVALLLALQVRRFWRTFAIFLLWTAGWFFLITLVTRGHSEATKFAVMAWYLACYPLTYIAVMASIEKGADERAGEARAALEHAANAAVHA